MGLDYSCHVGPYVRCKFSRVVFGRSVRTCPRKECSRHGERVADDKFCKECGAPVGDVGFPAERDSVNRHEVAHRLKDALYAMPGDTADDLMRSELVHVFLPNQKRGAARNYGFDPTTDVFFMGVLPADISAEVDSFSSDYAKELDVLREIYGHDSVEVCWGVANYIW